MDTTTLPQTAVTVNNILDRYQRDCLPELAQSTQSDYVRHLAVLRRLYGPAVASELRPKDFAEFLNVKQRGRVLRCKQLAVLSAAFTQAVSFWYVLERNVLRDVKRPKFRPRDRLVEQHEFEGVHALATQRVRLAMDLAVRTGQRQGDLLNMRWADIRGMEIHVCQSKTGKRLAIEITPDLEAVLDRCWQLPVKSEFVLTTKHGHRYTGPGFRACWQRTMAEYCKRGGSRFSFHDLRALAATRCETPEIAMRLLGHSNISMTLRVYRRGVERVKALEHAS